MSRKLIVLPDDSPRRFHEAIQNASESIRIKMFVFSDQALLEDVIAAHKRGVTVRVMLNPSRRSGEPENGWCTGVLQREGIEVMDSNPAFDVTHEKSMVVDGRIAFVKSLNWETENMTHARDYAIETEDPGEVDEVLRCFEADWHRLDFDSGENARLIWCVGNARERIAKVIDEAKHSLWLQNERYQDTVIIERLVRAKLRGVDVHVMTRPLHILKEAKLIEGVGGMRIMHDVGIKLHKMHGLKLHGKILIADWRRAVIGSINLSPGSFDTRRELAIEVRDEKILDRLREVLRHDWEKSKPLDLSDEGIRKDLQEFGPVLDRELALDPEVHGHGGKHKKS